LFWLPCSGKEKVDDLVIVKLMGGIGNQMFQYAAGRRLALKREVELKLDLTWFEGQNKRTYALEPFNIVADFTTTDEIRLFKGSREGQHGSFLAMFSKKHSKSSSAEFREKSFEFDPEVLELPGDTYLDGYWQNEKYFTDVGDTIRTELSVEARQCGRDVEIFKKIRSSSSVSLHIRRGDYISDKKTGDFHGSCSIDYYLNAAEYMTDLLNDPHFFVFSDDPEWVRTEFDFPKKMTLIDNNSPNRGHEDMRLLSQCDNHIIANSSFSWWGAWLCDYPDKIVIAPERWFNDPGMRHLNPSPPSWKRM